MCVDGPDSSGAEAAAASSERVANRQLDIQERLIPYFQQRQDQLDALTKEATQASIGIQRQTMEQGKDLYDYSVATFRPVEQSIVAQVMQDSTPAAYAKYAADASARTGQVFSNMSKASEQNMRSMGVNPNSSRFAASAAADKVQTALQGVKASNDAYDQAENRSYARKLDAAGLGRGLTGASAAAYGQATGAGSSAVSGANQTNNTAGSTIGTPVQYGQLGSSFMSNAMNGWGTVASSSGGGGMSSGMGSLIGMGASYFMSDEDTKEDRVRLDPELALRGLRRQRPESWRYKAEDAPGGDTDVHIGEMAQGVRRTMGNRAAPGGKVIDVREAAKHNQMAIEALLDRVDALTDEVHRLGG